jgi:hypothetical protein
MDVLWYKFLGHYLLGDLVIDLTCLGLDK